MIRLPVSPGAGFRPGPGQQALDQEDQARADQEHLDEVCFARFGNHYPELITSNASNVPRFTVSATWCPGISPISVPY